MKKHAIIPIFIPHMGCPNDCVFCNQRKITARTEVPTPVEVRNTIEEWLSTLAEVETVEVAFYGGSFTGLDIPQQSTFLSIAKEFKDAGRIHKVHLSTRPDYIDHEILTNLKFHGVDTVELGVQSFDDKVLRASKRGHTSAAVYQAVTLIKEYGFELGIQLMIGLPGDSMDSCLYSARETVALAPDLARLYPTIVIDDTELLAMYERGQYSPLSREEAIERTKEMYKILDSAGITIMRVGLKSTDVIGDGGAINGGTYHPAFRQLVEGRIARERIEALLEELIAGEQVPEPSDKLANSKQVEALSDRLANSKQAEALSNRLANSKQVEALSDRLANSKRIKTDSSLDGDEYSDLNSEIIPKMISSDSSISSAIADSNYIGESSYNPSEDVSGDSTCISNQPNSLPYSRRKVDVFTAPSWYSNTIGNCKENKKYFQAKYPELSILYKKDENLKPGEFRVVEKE